MKYIETTRPLFQLVDEAGNKLTDNQLVDRALKIKTHDVPFEDYLIDYTVLGDHNEFAKQLISILEPSTPFVRFFIVRGENGTVKVVGGYYTQTANDTNNYFGHNVAGLSIVAYVLKGVKVELI